MSENPARFVRYRGKTYGPFAAEELARMVKRGQITRLHELSTDSLNWMRAGEDESLFTPRVVMKALDVPLATEPSEPATQTAPAETADATYSVQASTASAPALPIDEWYYVIDSHRYGPLSVTRLRQMYQALEVNDETLVWRPGMTDWIPLSRAGLIGEPGQRSQSTSTSTRFQRPTAQAGLMAGEVQRRVGLHGTILGTTVGAIVLLCLHIPMVAGDKTMWWWDMMKPVGLGMFLVYLLLSSIALCILSPLIGGLARGIVMLCLGALGVLSLAISGISERPGGEMVLTYLLLLNASMLWSVSACRRLIKAPQNGRVFQGVLGGVVTGSALVLALILIVRATDAKAVLNLAPAIVFPAIFGVGLAFVSFIAAGICSLTNLRANFSASLNVAAEWLVIAGLSLCWLTPILLAIAVMDEMTQTFSTMVSAPDSAKGQVVFLLARIMTIVVAQFVILSRGLFELLFWLEDPAGKEQ